MGTIDELRIMFVSIAEFVGLGLLLFFIILSLIELEIISTNFGALLGGLAVGFVSAGAMVRTFKCLSNMTNEKQKKRKVKKR